MILMKSLYDRLEEYNASDYYGFHMPGHKRHNLTGDSLPYGIDITEIDGFDDLHHAGGILKEAQELAARVYGAEETRFLVNGSTVGILSAILGSTSRGDRILVPRHCHKSVYHAIYLNELRPVYLYPEFSEDLHLNTDISVSAVKAALMEYSDIRAVVIVSPTYDGVISDVKTIADAVHEYKIPLIVDEAHGAHLGFHPYFEANSLARGADVVIHSVHKTLPALTQTALLHVQGSLVNRSKVFRYLDMLQSSSPSYVLMAGIDKCVHLLDEQAEELFEPYVRRLMRLRKQLKGLKNLKLLETPHYDRSKVVISVKGQDMTGKELYQILLEKYHLQLEMAAGTYVIAMTSVADTEEGFERLAGALLEIDEKLTGEEKEKDISGMLGRLPSNEQVLTSAGALELGNDKEKTESIPLADTAGKIALEYAYLYPPGSPLIVPGERVSEEAAELLQRYMAIGFSIEGIAGEGYLKVLKNGVIADG